MDSPKTHLQFGSWIEDGSTLFRLLFEKAESVECLVFSSFRDTEPKVWDMRPTEGGIWELTIPENLAGTWYQYRVTYKPGEKPATPFAGEPFADPFSKHVTVLNNYKQQAKTLLFEDNYDWGEDTFISVQDPRDLVIYETHIKDLVSHPTSGSVGKSTYKRWLDLEQTGGISHLKKLGINAVEFLPLHKFPPVEPPYREKTAEGFHNTWNSYSQNYWGYMTSFFFAPETVYATDGSSGAGQVIGESIAAIHELKDVIKLLHANGISVIMDVVYNHTSLFDVNPACHHLNDIFLRRDEKGHLMNRSGTGNEIQTEHPAIRAMIIDSLLYWTKEFHIDGFRFDLAGLIDENSWDSIRENIKAHNPGALLIAEPWGGRYVPYLFSNHEWASWNDRFRNGIKGSNPHDDKGFIFSSWHHGSDRKHLENWFQGTLRELEGGLFRNSAHTVNYLESHDGYTLGDFIRISMRYKGENPVVADRVPHVALTHDEEKVAKLAAFCLLVTPGIAMIHAGQEFARSKLIVKVAGVEDNEAGRMDYNSYNKDNETNWINFNDLSSNRKLFNYYRGMISIRNESAALRKSSQASITFDHYSDPLHLCYFIDGSESGDIYDYYIAINATGHHDMEFDLPKGTWELLASDTFASSSPVDFLSGRNRIPVRSALLLRRLRHEAH